MERDKFACFRCGASILTRTHVLHERRPGPALGSTANTIILCGNATTECSQKVRANPVLSQKLGYSIPSTVDPLRVPVFHHEHGFVMLDRTGSWHRAHQRVIDGWEDECD